MRLHATPIGLYSKYLFYINFYWSIVAFQHYVSLYSIAKWIIHLYTYSSTFGELPPISVITEHWVQFPVLCSTYYVVRKSSERISGLKFGCDSWLLSKSTRPLFPPPPPSLTLTKLEGGEPRAAFGVTSPGSALLITICSQAAHSKRSPLSPHAEWAMQIKCSNSTTQV